MIEFIKKYGYILVGFLIISSIFYRWFSFGYIFTGDTWYISSNNIKSLYNGFLRIDNINLGYSLADLPRVIINIIVGRLTSLGLNRNGSIIRLFFLVPYFFLGFLGSYYLSLIYTKKKILGLLSGLLYVLNSPIILSLSMGHLHHLVPLGLFPRLLIFIKRHLNSAKNGSVSLMYVLTILFISSIYEFRFAFISLLSGLGYITYSVFAKTCSLKQYKTILFTILGGFICMNLYWIFPFLLSDNSSSIALLSRGPFGNGFRNILNGIGQFHAYWNAADPEIFVKQNITIYFFILPLVAGIGIFFIKKSEIIFYYLMLLFGILLVKQAGQPFPDLYNWIYNNIPGFNMFREGSRFFQLITLSYAILLPYALGKVYEKSFKTLYYLLLFGCGIYLLYLAVPIINGSNKTFFQVNEISKDYIDVNNVISSGNEVAKILYLPRLSSYLTFSHQMPGVSLVDVGGTIQSGFKDISSSSELIKNIDFDRRLDQMGVKYIILDKNNGLGRSDPFYRYEPRENYLLNLEGNKNILNISLSGNSIKMFENLNYYPLLSAKYSNIFYRFINPTKYNIIINIVSSNTGQELKFLQSFHSERKLYPGKSWTCDQPHTMTGQDIQYQPIVTKVNTGQTLTQLITQYQITTGEILDRNTGVTVTGGLRIGQQIVVGQQTGAVREYQTTECLQSGYTFFQGEELGYLWKKPLRDEGHTMVYDYANGRDISLTGQTGSQILAQGLQEGWIRPHTDGSYQVDLVLYFRPQSWFYLGLMISGTTLIGLLSRLLYGWVRERRKTLEIKHT